MYKSNISMPTHYSYNFSVCKRDHLNEDGSLNLASAFHAFYDSISEASSGRAGIAMEGTIRLYMAKKVDAVVHCVRPQGRADASFRYENEEGEVSYAQIELKSGCGALENIGKSKYIAYCPEVDMDDLNSLPEQLFVFEVEDFWYCLNERWTDEKASYHARGEILRRDSQRGTIHIQSFRSAGRPKASLPIREYLQDVCAEHETLSEFIERLRG